MKKIKTICAVVLAAAFGLGLAGCGGGSGQGGADTLWVTVANSSDELVLQNKLAKAFIAKKKEEGKDITIKRSTFSVSDYGNGISKLYATDTLGDVIFTYDTYASQYAETGWFDALDPYIERDGIDLTLYNQTIIESARAYEGQLTYFPRSYDQVTIFINNEFFRQMDMEDRIPRPKDNGQGEETWDWWTWSELLSLCADLRAAINEKKGNAASYFYPMDANLLWNAVYDPLIKSFGGNVVDVETMNSGFNSANSAAYTGTVNALNFMKSLMANKYTPDGYGSFTSGNNAMAFQTRPSVTSAISAGIDLSFAPVPKFDSAIDGIGEDSVTYVGYGSVGYAINKKSSKKELAWEFIKFAASEEGQAIIAANGNCIPTIKSQQTLDSAWTECVTDKEGNVVDQSAFLYQGNTLSLATYARGVKTDTEYLIYEKVRSNILDKLSKQTAESTAAYLYDLINIYIKK